MDGMANRLFYTYGIYSNRTGIFDFVVEVELMPFSPMDQNDKAAIEQRYVHCIHKVALKEFTLPDADWMRDTIQGRWCTIFKYTFAFENERDAVMFALKYSSH
jgi:hypothetical protein